MDFNKFIIASRICHYDLFCDWHKNPSEMTNQIQFHWIFPYLSTATQIQFRKIFSYVSINSSIQHYSVDRDNNIKACGV